MRARFLAPALAAVVLALSGCHVSSWSTSSSGYGSTSPWGSAGSTGELDVQAGHQTGAMGEIRTFDSDATRLEGTRSPGSTYVQLDSVGPGWWVMTGFSFDVDIDTLVPGQTYYADSLVGPAPASTPSGSTTAALPVSVDVRGCSGPADGDYTFDDLATQATFHVEELPSGLRRVHYDCTFVNDAGATQHASGTFDYASGGTGGAAPGSAAVDVRSI